MVTWQTVQKSAYLSDFIELSKTQQQAVVKAVEELEQDPTTVRGNTIKPLKGYSNVWRYRLGDHRLIYAVAQDARMLQLLAVGPRGSVYQRFNYDGWDVPDTAVEFGPELAKTVDWEARHREWSRPQPVEKPQTELPRRLTPQLLTKWRVPEQYHPILVRCRYEEELYRLAESKVPYEIFGRVVEGLSPATVAQIAAQPDQLLFKPEDLLAYAEGTLTGFLLRLDERQKPLTNWALAGPTLVKGGPGSGKSTVALYRVREVVLKHLAETGKVPRVLFTTFTNALINLSQSLLRQLLREPLELADANPLPPSIRATTLHKTAMWIARASGVPFVLANEDYRLAALQSARSMLQPRSAGDASKQRVTDLTAHLRDDYLLEEFDWVIEGQDCRTAADYLRAHRAGRGIAFPRSTRHAVWLLYEHYRRYLERQGMRTYGQITQLALDQVRSGAFELRWDYVVVDEAQDLAPAAIALCLELCTSPQGLFLTADANQSLYNRGFRWTNVHQDLNVAGRTRILKRNYRSTVEIAQAATEILVQADDTDGEAAAQEYVHSGPPPVVYAADGSADQARWIARQIYEAAREMRLPANAAAVLVHSGTVGQSLAEALQGHGLPAKFMRSRDFDLNEPAVKVTTLYAAKGLEFPIVVLAHVEAGRLPRESEADDTAERDAFLADQRRLFYVGCTRAMRYLFITYDRALPSPFLRDLSDDHWLMLEAGDERV